MSFTEFDLTYEVSLRLKLRPGRRKSHLTERRIGKGCQNCILLKCPKQTFDVVRFILVDMSRSRMNYY